MIVAACATPEKAPPVATEEPSHAPDIAVARPAPRPLKGPKRPGPIPVRPLNVAAECSFRDEAGYGGSLKLAVQEARVQDFDAAVHIPRRGMCRFALKDFQQTRSLPNVELSHRTNGCIVRMWEQGERVTVAFQQCEHMCTAGAYPYLWPILADRQDGSCT
jgi:hypothetical protein